MEMNYCRRCGSRLTDEQAQIFTCNNKHTLYLNRTPSVGIFLIDNEKKIILSVRGIEPRKGMLDSFGGFLELGETFEDAMRRELKEELNLSENEYTKPEYLTSGIGNYPFKGEIIPVICNFYWAELLTNRKLVPQDDVAGIVRSDVEDINFDDLHDVDVRQGFQKLKEFILTNKSQ